MQMSLPANVPRPFSLDLITLDRRGKMSRGGSLTKKEAAHPDAGKSKRKLEKKAMGGDPSRGRIIQSKNLLHTNVG